jgi:hypothetical protein
MTILALAENDGLTPTRKGPSEYSSPCPACGGRDRFVIFTDKNRYWCRQCKSNGDAIQYLRDFHGMTYAEAAEQVGKEIATKPAAATIRPAEPRQEQPAHWSIEAEKLIAYAHGALMQNPKALSWLLAERGIRRDTAERFRLGWIERNLYVKKERFGLPADGKKLFIPSGLVIPWQDRRIRIRRDDPDKYGRYYVLPGSENDPMTIGTPDQTTGVIVESELDAILLTQEAARPLYIVALGSTSMKPCDNLKASLWRCPAVLVALDNDEAGAKAARTWLEGVPGSFLTLTPDNKDLTDAYLAGLDLNTWLSASMALYCETLTEHN